LVVPVKSLSERGLKLRNDAITYIN